MKWRLQNGTIRKHPRGHHGHTETGQPVYHDPDDCRGDEYYPYSWIIPERGGIISFKDHGDHHKREGHSH